MCLFPFFSPSPWPLYIFFSFFLSPSSCFVSPVQLVGEAQGPGLPGHGRETGRSSPNHFKKMGGPKKKVVPKKSKPTHPLTKKTFVVLHLPLRSRRAGVLDGCKDIFYFIFFIFFDGGENKPYLNSTHTSM